MLPDGNITLQLFCQEMLGNIIKEYQLVGKITKVGDDETYN